MRSVTYERVKGEEREKRGERRRASLSFNLPSSVLQLPSLFKKWVKESE